MNVDKETGELLRPYIRRPFERVRHYTIIRGPSMTHQSHAESCDINSIIRRYDNTGVLPPARHEPSYADVTALQGDLTERYNQALETISTADEHFENVKKKQKESEKQKQLDIETEIAAIKEKLEGQSLDPPPAPK